jgi:type I restriction enzyme M protein
LVNIEELQNEEFNCNIRRYVDNSPPAEPHDVSAHLHGGIPVNEVDALDNYWKNYSGLRERLFTVNRPEYLNFKDGINSKEDIKTLLDASPEIRNQHARFNGILEIWWKANLPDLEALPNKNNIYALYHQFSATITTSLSGLGILDEYQSRGTFAAYWNSLDTDLRSVAASGWRSELSRMW